MEFRCHITFSILSNWIENWQKKIENQTHTNMKPNCAIFDPAEIRRLNTHHLRGKSHVKCVWRFYSGRKWCFLSDDKFNRPSESKDQMAEAQMQIRQNYAEHWQRPNRNRERQMKRAKFHEFIKNRIYVNWKSSLIASETITLYRMNSFESAARWRRRRKKRSTTNSELIYTSKQWTVQHRLKWNQTKLVYTFLLIVWFCIRAIFSARVPSIAFHLALCLCVCVFFLTWQLNTRACLRSHSNSSFDFAWTIHHFVHRYKVVIHILRNILYFIYIYIDIFIQKCALFIWSSPIWNAANKTSLATAMRKTHSTTTIYGMVYGLRSKPPIVFRALLFLYVSILHRQWRRCSFEMKNTK